MQVTRPDFRELIVLLTEGGEKAERGARMLYEHFWPKFTRYYCQHRQTEAVAEELANEAMLKIVRSITSVRDHGAVEGWAWTVARNTLLSMLRETADERENETLIDEQDWESLVECMPCNSNGDPVASLCIEQQTEKFIHHYPDRALCIERIVVDGWGLEEISAFLGRSYAATKEYVSQCRKRLGEYLMPCME